MTIEHTTRLLKWRAEWASAQPYPMVTPVFPGVTEWAAIVLVAFAVTLIAAAIFPRRT